MMQRPRRKAPREVAQALRRLARETHRSPLRVTRALRDADALITALDRGRRCLAWDRDDALGFARLLASYGCADDCASDPTVEPCGPCSAAAFLKERLDRWRRATAPDTYDPRSGLRTG